MQRKAHIDLGGHHAQDHQGNRSYRHGRRRPDARPRRDDAAAQAGLVNVNVENVLNGNQVTILQNVAISVAAALCNINTNVLSTQLQNNQRGDCPALSTAKQIAWVSYN